ncbi:hypothetical protein ABK040_007644 [Willaertia magna]
MAEHYFPHIKPDEMEYVDYARLLSWEYYHRCLSYSENLMDRIVPKKEQDTVKFREASLVLTTACTIEALLDDPERPYQLDCLDTIRTPERLNPLTSNDIIVENPNTITRISNQQEFLKKANEVKKCIEQKQEMKIFMKGFTEKLMFWRSKGSIPLFMPLLLQNFVDERKRHYSYEFTGNEDIVGAQEKIDFVTERYARKEFDNLLICMTMNSPATTPKFDSIDTLHNCLPEKILYHLKTHSVLCRRLYERCFKLKDEYNFNMNPGSYPKEMKMADRPFSDFEECFLHDQDIVNYCTREVDNFVYDRGANGEATTVWNKRFGDAFPIEDEK